MHVWILPRPSLSVFMDVKRACCYSIEAHSLPCFPKICLWDFRAIGIAVPLNAAVLLSACLPDEALTLVRSICQIDLKRLRPEGGGQAFGCASKVHHHTILIR